MKALHWVAFTALLMPVNLAQAQQAATLRAAPVKIETQAPVVSGSVQISNNGGLPMPVQVRIFKWEQRDGEDLYIPTKDVAISPPMIVLKPRSDSTVRVVRTSKAPLQAEESYRLVIDQLPGSTARNKDTAINFVVRHNIPVFFAPRTQTSTQVSYSVTSVKGGYKVMMKNSGTKYAFVRDVQLLAGGRVVAKRVGLGGYALAGKTGSFVVAGRGGGLPTRLKGFDANNNPIDVQLGR